MSLWYRDSRVISLCYTEAGLLLDHYLDGSNFIKRTFQWEHNPLDTYFELKIN